MTVATFFAGIFIGIILAWLYYHFRNYKFPHQETSEATEGQPTEWLQSLIERDRRHPRWEDKFTPKPSYEFSKEEARIWEHVFWKVTDLLMPFKQSPFHYLRMAVWMPENEHSSIWRGYCYDAAHETEMERGRPCELRLNIDEVASLQPILLKRERYLFSLFSLTKEPALYTWDWAKHMKAGLWAPIFHPEGDKIVRLVLFMHQTDPLYFEHTSRRQVIEVMVAHAALRLHLMWYRQLVRELRQEWLEWEVQVYRRFAQQLHDTLAQHISAIGMEIEYFYMRVRDRLSGEERAELTRLANLAREAAKEARHLLFLLRPVAIEEEGLEYALHDLARRMKQLYNQHVVLQLDRTILDKISKQVQIYAFYIISEAVTNARKHANADTITVRIAPSQDPDYFIVEVADNGKGFDISKVLTGHDRFSHYGLRSLKEQVNRLGGQLTIDSAPGQGTTVRVMLPYDLNGEHPDAPREPEDVQHIEQALMRLEKMFDNKTLDTPASAAHGGR